MNIKSCLRRFRRTGGIFRMTCVLAVATWLPAQDDGDKTKREDILPLPAWPAGSPDPLQTDHSLWPKDFDPNEIVHPAKVVSPEPKPNEDEIWSRFLPKGLFSGSGSKASGASKPLEDMPAAAWKACEEMTPETRLFDPQGLLSETQAEDMRRLLSFHSEREGVNAALILLDARQKLPANADLTHLAGGSLARAASCFVVYSLGEPDRTRVFFTQTVIKTAEPSYLENLASTCIREATENPDPVEQLQRFAIQLTIRLFWLERAYPTLQPAPVTPPPQPVVPAAIPLPVHAPVPPPVVHLPAVPEQPMLSEVTPPQSVPSLMSRATMLLAQSKNRLLIAAAAIAAATVLFVAGALLLRWKRRRLKQYVWILPELPATPPTRFGGPHCGASDAFIRYG